MTYDDVARQFGVQRCAQCDGSYDHRIGAQDDAVIHWSDRVFTRAGLRNFLLLVADLSDDSQPKPAKWQRLWEHNVWASSVARKELHITIPTRLSAADRAYVWWHIQSATDVPAAARAWARPRKDTDT